MSLGQQPEYEIPDIPRDITIISDQQLMTLFSEYMAWMNYAATSLAECEIEETKADSDVRRVESTHLLAAPSNETVTRTKATMVTVKEIETARDRSFQAYANRKLTPSSTPTASGWSACSAENSPAASAGTDPSGDRTDGTRERRQVRGDEGPGLLDLAGVSQRRPASAQAGRERRPQHHPGRRGDPAPGPVRLPRLATYANCIAIVARTTDDADVQKRLLRVADFFEDQAKLAAEEGYKLAGGLMSTATTPPSCMST